MAYSYIFKAGFRLKDNRPGAPFYEALIHFGWVVCICGGSGFIRSAWVNMVPVLYPTDTRLLREMTRNTSLPWCVSGLSSESAQRLSLESFHHARPLHCFFSQKRLNILMWVWLKSHHKDKYGLMLSGSRPVPGHCAVQWVAGPVPVANPRPICARVVLCDWYQK